MLQKNTTTMSLYLSKSIKISKRHFVTNEKRKRISIVGSGPSGFYTAYHMLTKSTIPLNVTLWEKLLVPFGLSRYGVAPDHPEVKNCEATFTECANEFSGDAHKHKFEFVGGVEIGKQIALSDLLAQEDAVILSYGCVGDRRLGIEGEETTKGVFSSRQFVNWYNGHPDFAFDPKFTKFDWSKVKNVSIIGNGNVALDLARIILSNRVDEIWGHTDISPVALSCLKEAPIKDVKIIARRDFIHSKFTNKELRELWELEKFGIHGKIKPEYFNPETYDINKIKDRVFKRRVEMCSEYLKPFDKRTKKNYKKNVPPLIEEPKSRLWELDYLKSPLQIESNSEGVVSSLKLCRNKITDDNRVVKLPDDQIDYPTDLLITSLGYAGEPLNDFSSLGIGFDRDHMASTNGRVQDTNGQTFPKLYASGWIQKGSVGVIATTMQGAFNVADVVMQDLSNSTSNPISQTIDISKIKHTTWSDWLRINKSELQKGQKQDRTRAKYLKNQDIWDLLKVQ